MFRCDSGKLQAGMCARHLRQVVVAIGLSGALLSPVVMFCSWAGKAQSLREHIWAHLYLQVYVASWWSWGITAAHVPLVTNIWLENSWLIASLHWSSAVSALLKT